MESNYLDANHVPDEFHAEGMALQYVEIFRMPLPDVLAMRYAEFTRLTLLHKAVTMRRPAKFVSDHEYNMNNTRKHYGL